MTLAAAFTHLTADLSGVRAEYLRDRSLVGGLLIAAVAGAGLAPLSTPAVHERADGGFTLVVLLEPGHIVVHTLPDRERLIADMLTPADHDPGKAVDVFVRRLAPANVRSERRAVG